MPRERKVSRSPKVKLQELKLVEHPSWISAGKPAIGTGATISGVAFVWAKVTSPDNGVYTIVCKPRKSAVKSLDDMRTVIENTITGRKRLEDAAGDCDAVIAELAIRAFRFDFDNGVRSDMTSLSPTEKVARAVRKVAEKQGKSVDESALKRALAALGLD